MEIVTLPSCTVAVKCSMVANIAPFLDDVGLISLFVGWKSDHLPSFAEEELADLWPCDVIIQPHSYVSVAIIQQFGRTVVVVRVTTFIVPRFVNVLLHQLNVVSLAKRKSSNEVHVSADGHFSMTTNDVQNFWGSVHLWRVGWAQGVPVDVKVADNYPWNYDILDWERVVRVCYTRIRIWDALPFDYFLSTFVSQFWSFDTFR